MALLITPADRIVVAGHRGMAGSAICRALTRSGYTQILTATRQELDLLDGPAVERWFAEHQPTVVVLAAATALLGKQLHLPQVCRAADPRGSSAHRPAGAHQ